MKIFEIVRDFVDACGNPDFELVKKLYPLIEDVNFTIVHLQYNFLQKNDNENYYYTPLYSSSSQNSKENYKVIQFLLEKGADPNFKCNDYWGIGSSPLHSMIANSFESMPFRIGMNEDELQETDDEIKLETTGLKLLVEYGAEINIKDAKGRTPLDWSIRFDHNPAERYLRRLGAKKGSEISDEENFIIENKLSESVKKMNYHFISWEESPYHGVFIELDNEGIPDF